MTEDEIRNNLEALLDSINTSEDLVIIQREGIAVGGLVMSKDIEELRERRVGKAWEAFDEKSRQDGIMNEDALMELVTEEGKAIRTEMYAERKRAEADRPDK